ncbi:MAG TPA: META domain-containing protein [Thiolapillus brandeum]|uniref:META domain-containing protein n=1 Tax=Thiolapillus brandeum TaxID=1076588 RepID=A0A831RUX2_9GAMM|nr:META domain-containing protein [Thiolapillus brandeum]
MMPLRKIPGIFLVTVSLCFLSVAAVFSADDGVPVAGDKPVAAAGPPVSANATAPERGLVEGFELKGDLDNDGEQEIVLALWDSPGGSGVFNYLVILDLHKGQVSSHSLFVGDRVQILGGDINGNKISIDLVEQAAGDPVCCPSQKATRTWVIEDDGTLRELPVKITGKLTVEDIGGTEWVLRSIGEQAVPPEPQITLTYEDGRINGSSGCNNYFADMKDQQSEAGGVKVGPVGSTRKACPSDIMELEGQYLKYLGQVSSFSFMERQLVLSWAVGNQTGTLVFSPGRKVE